VDLSIAFGLAAALCWGTSDFAAKISAGRIGALRTALFLQYVGGVFLILVAFQDVARLWLFPTATYFALGLGAINAAAAFSLFKGFEVGQLSIVSPIASSYPALSTALAVLLLNEHLSATRFAAILAILVGIVLVSIQHPSERLVKGQLAAGVGYAMVAFLALGFIFFALKLVVGSLGALLTVLLVRIMSATILTCAVILTPRDRSPRKLSSYLPIVLLIGIVDTLGNITYNLGILGGAVSVVATISGLFSAVTVILAFIVLKERLAAHQAIGLLIILFGVLIIGYVA
jgi:drug/metabolite transporter (DMT)-like permease